MNLKETLHWFDLHDIKLDILFNFNITYFKFPGFYKTLRLNSSIKVKFLNPGELELLIKVESNGSARLIQWRLQLLPDSFSHQATVVFHFEVPHAANPSDSNLEKSSRICEAGGKGRWDQKRRGGSFGEKKKKNETWSSDIEIGTTIQRAQGLSPGTDD